eukprot:835428-Rhodomonas_salina.1
MAMFGPANHSFLLHLHLQLAEVLDAQEGDARRGGARRTEGGARRTDGGARRTEGVAAQFPRMTFSLADSVAPDGGLVGLESLRVGRGSARRRLEAAGGESMSAACVAFQDGTFQDRAAFTRRLSAQPACAPPQSAVCALQKPRADANEFQIDVPLGFDWVPEAGSGEKVFVEMVVGVKERGSGSRPVVHSSLAAALAVSSPPEHPPHHHHLPSDVKH